MLTVKNISFAYGSKQAVNNVSFQVTPGRILGLLGPNGCGKTTTFRLLTNLYQLQSGEILLFGQKINYDNVNLISYMTEERSLIPKYKVMEMLVFLGKLKGLSDMILKEKINELLALFHLEEYKNSLIRELSKGNQQKIQFISCLLNNPKLLVLDEPFTGLDVLSVNDLILVFNMLREQGVMIIFSSHRINDVENFCDDVCLLNNGQVILTGDLQEIKRNYPIKVIKFFAPQFNKDMINQLSKSFTYVKADNYYKVTTASNTNLSKITSYLKTLDNLSFLSVEDSSLEQIFIAETTRKE